MAAPVEPATREDEGPPELLAGPAAPSGGTVAEDELSRAFSGTEELGSAAPGHAAPGHAAPGHAASEHAAPGVKPWSKTKLKEAKRTEMQSRIRELEKLAAQQPAPGVDRETATVGQSPEVLEEQTRAALVGTFAVVSALGAKMRGDHWRLSSEETAKLAGVWAPVLAPHMGTLAGYLPLGVAVAVTAEVVWPRIEADMGRAKIEDAAPVPVRVEEPKAT